MAESKVRKIGYQCPVKGCVQRNNRRFGSPMAVAAHIVSKHGDDELSKRLRLKTGIAPGRSEHHRPKQSTCGDW